MIAFANLKHQTLFCWMVLRWWSQLHCVEMECRKKQP